MRLYTTQVVATAIVLCMALNSSAGKFNRVLDIGDDAPQWPSIDGTDGKSHTFESYHETDILVLAFSCNSCPISQAYEKRFIEFADRYKDKSVRLIAIGCSRLEDDSLEPMKRRAKERGYNFDYLFDEGQKLGRAYGASVTPHLFVLDQERHVRYMGAFDDNLNVDRIEEQYVIDAVNALLAGDEIDVTESRQRGCEIDYGPVK